MNNKDNKENLILNLLVKTKFPPIKRNHYIWRMHLLRGTVESYIKKMLKKLKFF